MNRFTQSLIAIAVLFLSVMVYGDSTEGNWPAWRGPEATGVAAGCNPPTVWSETENVKWKVPLNTDGSAASPIVWGDRIFFQTAVMTDKKVESAEPAAEPEQAPPAGGRGGRGGGGSKPPTNFYRFNVVCLDRGTGKTLWEKTVCEAVPHQGHQPTHGFASYSPVTDGAYVWANFGSQGLYCYDFNGTLVWKNDLIQRKTMFGEGGSLALAGDRVVVTADGDAESWIFAFDKKKGTPLWKQQRDEKTTYGTPVVITYHGTLQVITPGINKIRSYDVKTGDLVWERAGIPDSMIPTPVVGFDMLLCAVGGRGKGEIEAIKLGGTGDEAIVWGTKDVAPFVPSPLLYGSRLYVYSANAPRLSCFEAPTGKVLFDKQPLDQLKDVYASPVGAADRIYCAGRNGITYVVKNADTFEVLATNKLDDEFSGTPAIAGNELYLKGRQNFYCIALSK